MATSIDALLRQTQQNLAKVNAKTSAISSALQPFGAQAASYFQNAQNAQSSLGSALSNSMTAQGQQLGGQIGQQLTDIQAPGAALLQYAQGTAQMGSAAGQAIGALSSADLARLQSQGTAEQIYASALPRLAELAGAQERRNMLAQAQQDLQDLAVQQAQTNYQNAIAEREFQYKVYQDTLAQKNANRAYKYKVQQDKKASALAAQKQALSEKALNAAIGYKAGSLKEKTWADQRRADTAAYNALTARQRAGTQGASLQERIRHDQKMESISQQRANTAATKSSGTSAHAKAWDSIRKATFSRAQTYGKTYKPKALLKANRGIDKATARQRLQSEFGSQLRGKGFGQKEINQMISNALAAAGY